MHLIKLNAIDSTNSYLRALYANEPLEDFTAVMANTQTQGRGQMGALWQSQKGKNLTFSVFKDLKGLNLDHTFFISIVTTLALIKALEQFYIERLSIKWPNDILSVDKKISGILIENVIKQDKITASFVGIGLNVNQTKFENLPQASSLKNITGGHFDLNELVVIIIENLKVYFTKLKKGNWESLKQEYESYLFRKNKPSTFKDTKGLMFSGFIRGVSHSGKLQVIIEDEIIKSYDLKEITLLY